MMVSKNDWIERSFLAQDVIAWNSISSNPSLLRNPISPIRSSVFCLVSTTVRLDPYLFDLNSHDQEKTSAILVFFLRMSFS